MLQLCPGAAVVFNVHQDLCFPIAPHRRRWLKLERENPVCGAAGFALSSHGDPRAKAPARGEDVGDVVGTIHDCERVADELRNRPAGVRERPSDLAGTRRRVRPPVCYPGACPLP
jgi:hypothetical protein